MATSDAPFELGSFPEVMNFLSGKHLLPFTKKGSKRNRDFVKHLKKYQATMTSRRMPPLNSFIAAQSECIDYDREDEDVVDQYIECTHTKHRKFSNPITRPFNLIDADVEDPIPSVFDASHLDMDWELLRNNPITDAIGCS